MVRKSAEKREYLFVTDEASSLKDEEMTAEEASLFIEFLTLNGLYFIAYQCEQVFTNEYRNICVYQILEKKGHPAPQHIVSANAI